MTKKTFPIAELSNRRTTLQPPNKLATKQPFLLTKKPSLFLAAITLLATGLLSAEPAMAQAKNMQGFSIALNLNASASSIDLAVTDGVKFGRGGVTSHSNSLGLQLQYAAPLSERTALTVGITTDLGGVLIGEFTPTEELMNIQDITSLHLAPGYFVSQRIFAYGKVGAVSAASNFGGLNHLNGTAYGIGIQYMESENIFFQTELQQITFNEMKHDYLGLHFTDNYVIDRLSASIGYKF